VFKPNARLVMAEGAAESSCGLPEAPSPAPFAGGEQEAESCRITGDAAIPRRHR